MIRLSSMTSSNPITAKFCVNVPAPANDWRIINGLKKDIGVLQIQENGDGFFTDTREGKDHSPRLIKDWSWSRRSRKIPQEMSAVPAPELTKMTPEMFKPEWGAKEATPETAAKDGPEIDLSEDGLDGVPEWARTNGKSQEQEAA